MSTHIISFNGELTNIILQLSLIINKYTPNLDAKTVTSFVVYWYKNLQAKSVPLEASTL